MKNAQMLDTVYIYIYISKDLIKQFYVNIEKKLCILGESKIYGFLRAKKRKFEMFLIFSFTNGYQCVNGKNIDIKEGETYE